MIEFNVRHIDNAIQKSVTDKSYTLYRGVRNISWIENPNVGGVFKEDAFGSYTLNFDKALGYTKLENPMIFRLKLAAEEYTLYVDQSEKEILCPRKSTYEITKIKGSFVEKFNKRVKIYYIKKLKE